ncbi:MAG: helix-turn-helix transcriptional regulator [Lachnospiraceae bacterium]|nr:helix-turn-helix transcriptional regulator [Lachnospiraceae bacterium]
MKSQEAVARRLTKLCYEKGCSLYQLSYGSGVHVSTIKSIMNGKSQNPGIKTLARLCEGLGIEVQDFFEGEEFEELEFEEDEKENGLEEAV